MFSSAPKAAFSVSSPSDGIRSAGLMIRPPSLSHCQQSSGFSSAALATFSGSSSWSRDVATTLMSFGSGSAGAGGRGQRFAQPAGAEQEGRNR